MKYKKTIINTIAILMALPLIIAMYGGETQTLEFSFETDDCIIVPNVTEGVEFNFTGNQVIVKPALNFIGEFNITCYDWLTKETETQSGGSSGGGSAAPRCWTSKDGYDEECLSGKTNTTNETIHIPTDIIEDKPEPEITEPVIQEDKPNKMLVKILIVFAFVLGICLVIYLFYKIFKKEPEEYIPETIKPVEEDGIDYIDKREDIKV